MAQFEYKVVPAPSRGEKVKGVKQPEMRFAHTVEGVLNMMAGDGWEFVRSEMLPSEERSGLSRSSKEWRNLLIFRREKGAVMGLGAAEPAAADRPAPVAAPPVEPERAPLTRTKTPPVAAPKEQETRGRSLARQVRGPADDTPEDPPESSDGPFEIRSVDEAAEASPFRNWRGRS